MVKPRVYGQQVLVKVFSGNTDKKPFVIDFDKISVEAKVNNQAYRSIGKSVTSHQAVSLDGFTITLERSKRDDYLMEFYYLLNEAHKGRLECFEVIIEKTITHTYSQDAIIPSVEFAEAGVGQPLLELGAQYLVTQANSLKNLARSTAESFIKNNKLNQEVNKFIKGNQFLETLKSQYESDIVRAIAIMPYVETYSYVNCTLAGFNNSDEANQLSTESIVFHASDLIRNGDRSAMTNYLDELMYKYFQQVEEKHKSEVQKAIIGLMDFGNKLKNAPANLANIATKGFSLATNSISSLVGILTRGGQ